MDLSNFTPAISSLNDILRSFLIWIGIMSVITATSLLWSHELTTKIGIDKLHRYLISQGICIGCGLLLSLVTIYHLHFTPRYTTAEQLSLIHFSTYLPWCLIVFTIIFYGYCYYRFNQVTKAPTHKTAKEETK